MATAHGIEPLLKNVETLSPAFGRAQVDIEAVVTRGRNADFRGVLQNTRLVVETLLRAILAKKKQSPGKQTLEQLVNKLQQTLPTPIMVHVRTIQAWGNVGAHDHAADLFDEGVEVSETEALAALHSFVAILTWYKNEYLSEPSDASPPAKASPSAKAAPAAKSSSPAAPPAPSSAPPAATGSKRGLVMALSGVVALMVGGGIFWGLRGSTDGTNSGDGPAERADRTAIDGFYARAGEPAFPARCRAKAPALVKTLSEVARWLEGGQAGSARAEDQQAVARLEASSTATPEQPEQAYLLAKARLFAGRPAESVRAAVDTGLSACPEASALHNLKGRLLFQDEQFEGAEQSFEQAVRGNDRYIGPRFNLGLIYLKTGRNAEALSTFNRTLELDPEYIVAYRARGALRMKQGDLEGAAQDFQRWSALDKAAGQASLMLGQVLLKMGKENEARQAFCRAKGLGEAKAEPLCP